MDFLITFRNILLIIVFVLLVTIVLKIFKAKKRKRQVIYVNTGTVGSGKTYLAVDAVQRQYKKVFKMYKRSRKWFWRFFFPSLTTMKAPMVFSNIPLYLAKRKKYQFFRKFPFVRIVKTFEYSNVLTRQHLLLESTFPVDCTPIVLIDELGTIANQYSYSDPHIVSPNLNDNYQCIETFIRFFRHFYGEGNGDNCRLYITDQSCGNITVGIRRRLSTIDYLSDFKRFLFFLPFYKVNVREMLLCDDSMQNVNQTQTPEQFGGSPLASAVAEPYYFGFLPYRRFSKVHYDSHCFSATSITGFVPTVSFANWRDNDFNWTDAHGWHMDILKTNYCPDLRMTLAEKKAYKAHVASYGLSLSDVATNPNT